jgi:hypothetical protein
MPKWISGKDLLKRWNIFDFELFEYVKQGLQPHSKLCKPISPPDVSEELNHAEKLEGTLLEYRRVKHLWETRSKSKPIFPIVRIFHVMDIMDGVEDKIAHTEQEIKTQKEKLSQMNIYSWGNCQLPESEEEASSLFNCLANYIYKMDQVEEFEKEFNLGPNKKDKPDKSKSTDKKLRPNQKHKIECRKVAERLWKKDPTTTIADMIMKDEIVNACDGKIYSEKTIRNWINILCPDRSPGRRPKKK